jgi:hypothetical protein
VTIWIFERCSWVSVVFFGVLADVVSPARAEAVFDEQANDSSVIPSAARDRGEREAFIVWLR